MAYDDKILITLLGVTLIILKICNMIYIKNARKQRNDKLKQLRDVEFISSNVEYETFEDISKQSLSLNRPLRTQDDFLDFIISNTDKKEQASNIESTILKLR